ncbi:TonB-dependent receptor [Hyphomonas sp.]|uniref:TonB-dependent receptor n=1 Tax=Hyphomonas sp. TaxID=87 RepID=UPI00391AD0C5
MKLSRPLLSSASAALIAFVPAHAQVAGATERDSAVERVLDTISVTATKKADVENVQSVPVAITAFNAETLEALQVRDIQSLSYASPNVQLEDIGTARGTANFSIRGLGINSSIPSVDPTVGVFVDGVYLGINSGVVLDLFDLDSVEILRGPQGLLFGRNTTGGAVLINTADPTDTFQYKAKATYEGPVDDGRGGPASTLQAGVSGPLIKDRLNGKIGAYYSYDSGYFNNKYDNSNIGEAQTFIVRGALEYTPSDDFTLLGKLESFTTQADGPAAKNSGVYGRDNFDLAVNNIGSYKADTTFGSLRADYDVAFGNGRVTNIFGYRDFNAANDADIDSLPLTLLHSPTQVAQEQFSNELRYAGAFGPAEVTTGLFWFNQEIGYSERRILPTVSPDDYYGGGRQDHTVYGIFGQVDYAFTDKWTGIFGLRYGTEEKTANITYVRPRPACSVIGNTCPTTGTNPLGGLNPLVPVGEPNGFTDSQDWSNLNPKIGFQYTPGALTQIYGHYTQGVRSGGYNFRISTPVAFEALFPAGSSRAVDEEGVNAYELGFKTETADRKGQLNAAVFFNDITDMQRELNLSSPSSGVAQTIVNTADAEILGFEAEGRYALTGNLLLTANVGLLDAEYTNVIFDISGNGAVGAEDLALALPRVPEMTYGFGVLHDLDLADRGALVSRVSFQHRDAFAYTDNNFGYVNEADMVDANFTWNTPFDGLSVSLFGKNLLDEVVSGGDTQVPFGGALAPLVPGGQNLSDGTNDPFDPNPAAGTFQPLQPGRTIGIEFTIRG